MEQEAECKVCNGSGYYPIITREGAHLYDIQCPECQGTGKVSVLLIQEDNT